MLVKNKEYKRSELHEKFGGQKQGGICTPSHSNIILLFTGDTGELYGYKDDWANDKLFYYTGEGQRGDMQFTRGNKAILNHNDDHKELHLFQKTRKAYVKYLGQMTCIGFHHENKPDITGQDRDAIIFELIPVEEEFITNQPDLNTSNT